MNWLKKAAKKYWKYAVGAAAGALGYAVGGEAGAMIGMGAGALGGEFAAGAVIGRKGAETVKQIKR
jgi:uncharacterized protein YcfJ